MATTYTDCNRKRSAPCRLRLAVMVRQPALHPPVVKPKWYLVERTFCSRHHSFSRRKGSRVELIHVPAKNDWEVDVRTSLPPQCSLSYATDIKDVDMFRQTEDNKSYELTYSCRVNEVCTQCRVVVCAVSWRSRSRARFQIVFRPTYLRT